MRTATDYKPTRFWLEAVTGSWICWGISVWLSIHRGNHTLVLFFYFLGILPPLVTALIFIFGSGNTALKADFKNRLFNLRLINPRYLVFTIGLPPVLMLVSLGLSLLFGQSTDQFRLAGTAGQLLPMIILTMIIAPIIEEIAWRGYGMDSLRAKLGLLSASLAFGVLWSFWHAPLVLIKGSYHYQLAHMDTSIYLANFFLSVVFISVFVSWLYYKHHRSIPAGILLHLMFNASAVLPAATQFTKCINSVLYLVVAIAIVLFDKQMFAEGPRDFVAESNNLR